MAGERRERESDLGRAGLALFENEVGALELADPHQSKPSLFMDVLWLAQFSSPTTHTLYNAPYTHASHTLNPTPSTLNLKL